MKSKTICYECIFKLEQHLGLKLILKVRKQSFKWSHQ